MAGISTSVQPAEEMSSVIYIGHLPHGFYEDELRKYYTQFGKVLRVKVSRSKKTGGSKGYAFVEFANKDVAKIASDATDNYLMFEKLLKSNVLPVSKVHPELFKNTNRRFTKPKAHLVAIQRHNKPPVPKAVKEARKKKKAEKEEKRKMAKKLRHVHRIQMNLEEIATPRTKPVPSSVRTPKGKLHVLKEDPSDMEITFLTPPTCIKSSKLRLNKEGKYEVKTPPAAPAEAPKAAKKAKKELKDQTTSKKAKKETKDNNTVKKAKRGTKDTKPQKASTDLTSSKREGVKKQKPKRKRKVE